MDQKRQAHRKKIATKVVTLVAGQLVLGLLAVLSLLIILVNQLMSEQIEAQLEIKATAFSEKVEQHLEYLVDNTELLTSNRLMVNALTDSEGRSAYLPPLVDNFMEGKDIKSFNLVDFEGHPIFQTSSKIPTYENSARLRVALALNKTSHYYDTENGSLFVVSPIEYYSTTQGAVIVEFEFARLLQRHLSKIGSAYVALYLGEKEIFDFNLDANKTYRSFEHNVSQSLPMLQHLGISIRMGMPSSEFNEPVKKAVMSMASLGLVFLFFSVYVSSWTTTKITDPVLKLYDRVKRAGRNDSVLCYPLGSDDELEDLAQAFDERTQELQFQAEHDSLTGLPNRVLLLDRLNQSLKAASRESHKVALMFIDLDRFKEVNDSLGHIVGDELLKKVASELKNSLRNYDTVSRLGGDEFTVLLSSFDDDDDIITVIQKVMSAFRDPYKVLDQQLFITCSLGVAIYPDDAMTAEELLKNADAAMYRAKDLGRNTYEFYTRDLTEKAYERVLLEAKLRKALRNNEFEVYYQPQVDMQTETLTGMESLIRWNEPDSGFISPAKFIPIAEDNGMIIEIDRWMMKVAMSQFAIWKSKGYQCGVLSMNLSMVQLHTSDFFEEFEKNLNEIGLLPQDITLEVTETQAMKDPDKTIVMLKRLKDLGISIAIDDFGTGFSSLSYLKKFPIDRIKVDKSFIDGIPEDPHDSGLTNAIIALSKSLNKGIIAEGVETREQSVFLMENGCRYAQGYYYFKPTSKEQIEKLFFFNSKYLT